jgi:hypothetical protein
LFALLAVPTTSNSDKPFVPLSYLPSILDIDIQTDLQPLQNSVAEAQRLLQQNFYMQPEEFLHATRIFTCNLVYMQPE